MLGRFAENVPNAGGLNFAAFAKNGLFALPLMSFLDLRILFHQIVSFEVHIAFASTCACVASIRHSLQIRVDFFNGADFFSAISAEMRLDLSLSQAYLAQKASVGSGAFC